MIRYLKEGITEEQAASDDARVRKIVEDILADIRSRGDAAVLDYSERFDKWRPQHFRLSREEIDACYQELDEQVIEDIRFAQAQVRNFAEIQKSTLTDVEVETLPGVILGHKNTPVNSVGCYVPGGKYPLVASAHMSVVTAKVAGVKRVIAAAPPFEGQAEPGDRGCDGPGRCGRDLLLRRRAGDRRDGAGYRKHRAGGHDCRSGQRVRG